MTKRIILSFIARMFDPLGWLTPFIFSCKSFMQRLWRHGLEWDEVLSDVLQEEWKNITNEISTLSEVRLPRWFNFTCSSSLKGSINLKGRIQIIGFAVASQLGYAAALYIRHKINKRVHVSLLVAKSRVAPNKSITIPRLELNAAYLLTKLYASMKPFLNTLPSHEVIFFFRFHNSTRLVENRAVPSENLRR